MRLFAGTLERITRRPGLARALVVVACLVVEGVAAAQTPLPPRGDTSVHDQADVLTPDQEAELERLNRALFEKTQVAIVVLTVPQLEGETIEQFGELTQDTYFIHMDPERARTTAFGGTIAHGFLTLSMLSCMAYQVCPFIEGTRNGVNYGFNRLRFVAPVPSGGRVRGRFLLRNLDVKSDRWQATWEVSVEIENGAKPAIVAPKFDFKFDDKFHQDLKAKFPKDLSVHISKQGDEPSKIHVKHAEQEWNVTEKTIGELPEEIRMRIYALAVELMARS